MNTIELELDLLWISLHRHARYGREDLVRVLSDELIRHLPLPDALVANIEHLLERCDLSPAIRACLERVVLRHAIENG